MRLFCFLLVAAACSGGHTSREPVLNDYDQLILLFSKPGARISDSAVLNTLHEDSFDIQNRTFRVLEKRDFSDKIHGLIYTMDCQAGGLCDATNLVTFDSDQYADRLQIGHQYGDDGFDDKLTYKITSNKVQLHLKQVDYDEDENGNRTEILKVDSTYSFSIDLVNGKLIRE